MTENKTAFYIGIGVIVFICAAILIYVILKYLPINRITHKAELMGTLITLLIGLLGSTVVTILIGLDVIK